VTDGTADVEPQPSQPGAGPGHREPEGAFDPPRLLRIAGVVREVLDEARRIRPEDSAVQHLRTVLDRVTAELHEALPPELFRELDELTPGVREGTLEELTLAHAEILGWLQGLFQGTQLAIQLQAIQAQQAGRRPLQPPRPAAPEPGVDPTYL